MRTHWDIHVTLTARSRMATGKARGGYDDLVAEMLHGLPWSVLLEFHSAFLRRFRGDMQGEPSYWRLLLIVLLPKISKASDLQFTGASAC